MEDIKLLLEQVIQKQAEQDKLIKRIGELGRSTSDQLGAFSSVIYDNAQKLHELGEYHKTLQKKYEIWPTQSATTEKINAALSLALNELKTPMATGGGSRGKSLSIDDMRLVYPGVFGKHGLSVTQHPMLNEYREDILVTKINHTSGEWHQSVSHVPAVDKTGKWDPQELSKNLSWLRRLHLHDMLGFGKEEESGE